ncbi:MAG: polyamine aminopropyltransferase [Gammaproteobacteria bacterium]
MLSENHWLTEECEEGGSAFSMRIRSRLHQEQTPFQRIEIYATEYFGNAMVIDGFVMLTEKDNFIYHEMMSHPALFWHPHPKRVVIVGGGDCGTIREVLKHREVEQCIQIELDERVTRLAEQYFPSLCESNNDPRAEFRFMDAIEWMRHARPSSVDVIIVDSTDPVGPAEGLFAEEFYRDCRRTLDDHGIMVQQSESPLFHMDIIKFMRKAMARVGFKEVRSLCFPLPTYPSGWWTATLACKDDVLGEFRQPDVDKRPFVTRYYNTAIHHAAMAAPEFFQKELKA